MKIEKDRPLPRHTKLDYTECYAKLILERFFPDEYKDLKISDKPDLRDNDRSIGIEVTSAIPEKEQKAVYSACEIPYIEVEKRNKRISFLRKQGYEYTSGWMSHPPRCYGWWDTDYPEIEKTFCNDFIQAVERKIEILNNDHYAVLSRYDLFVKSDLSVEEWMPEKLMEKLCSLYKQRLHYTFIYLLTFEGLLYIFDIESRKYSMIDPRSELQRIGELARELIEEGELE